jgi:hypothetical protein
MRSKGRGNYARGEGIGGAVATQQNASWAKHYLAAGRSVRWTASKLSLSYLVVYHIAKGNTWAWLEPAEPPHDPPSTTFVRRF